MGKEGKNKKLRYRKETERKRWSGKQGEERYDVKGGDDGGGGAC